MTRNSVLYFWILRWDMRDNVPTFVCLREREREWERERATKRDGGERNTE